MSLITPETKAKAEVYYGDKICREKTKELLKTIELPNGLFPLKDIKEFGFVRETGFMWLKQKKSITHKFETIGNVSYATEVTGFVEPKKIKKITGLQKKDFLVSITISDMFIDDPPTSGKINFLAPSGMSASCPVSAFQVEEPEAEAAASGSGSGTGNRG